MATETTEAKITDKNGRIAKFNEIMSGIDMPEGFLDWLVNEREFFTTPASIRFHGNYEGGLFDHSYEVTCSLVRITEGMALKWQNPRSPKLVGMFHDLCKTGYYIKATDGEKEFFKINPKPEYENGHGDISVTLLSKWFELTEEEELCILHHMGAFTDRKEWTAYNKAIGKYETVLWSHTADMVASMVMGV